MNNDADKKRPLVEALEQLSRSDDRAELARLRAYWRAGHELEALPFVLPFLPAGRANGGVPLSDAARRRNEDDALLLAALFALHPESGPTSLARALRQVWLETGRDSVEGRFRALLSAERAELGTHLRHAVSLVAAKGSAVDWGDLYHTLKYWGADDPRWNVRRRWAREFWSGPHDAEGLSTDASADQVGSAP